MPFRSVEVRYTASVGQAVRELNSYAKANDAVGVSAERSSAKVDKMAAGGAVLAFGFGVAAARFAEFDAAMSAVGANTDTTTEGLNNLRDAAVTAGKETAFTATEAAQGITELAKAGLAAEDILSGGLKGALDLAAAGQIGVAEAAESMATSLVQFKLNGEDATHVADLLAAGANKAQGSVSDLAQALKQGGLVAAQTGLSIDETTTALTAFASAGLIGSDAGTSLKTMLQRLTPQSDAAAGLMEQLGISGYNAAGSFVGLEALAGNLRDALHDLTPEQRNAALAVIFGSDAVRGASVLYNQGAEGIASWSKEVNKSGFAARQAAELTNNLKGDVERLGGSFDTVLIQGGSGANGVLRITVQTLENLVDVVGQIPGPMLAGAAAFGSLVLLGPKVGQLAKTIGGPLTGSLTRFREELALQRALGSAAGATYDGLGDRIDTAGDKARKGGEGFTAAGKAVGGMRGVASGVMGLLGGPWGIALTAATVGVTAFATAQANANAAGQEFADTLDEQTGAFTELSRSFVGKKLTGDISGEDLRTLQNLGVSLSDVTDRALEGGPAVQAMIENFRARAANEGLQVFSALASALENTNEDVERGKLVWAGYDAAIKGSTGSAALADRIQDDISGSTDSYTHSVKTATTRTGEMGTSLDAMATNAEDAKTALDNLKSSVELLGGGASALQEAQDAVAASTRDLATAGKKEKDDNKTKAERAEEYRAALRKLGDDTRTLLQAQIDQNVSVGTLKNTYDTQREAVEKSLKAHGFHGKKLEEEATKILGTRDDFNLLLLEYAKNPAVIASQITTPGLEKAKTDVEGYWTVINGVPTFVKTKFDANTADASKSVKGLAAAIANINDKTVTITAIYQKFGFQASLEASQARRHPGVFFASGGPVFGPGTETSDSIPILASNDEHMLSADEVRGLGGHSEVERLRALARARKVPRFRDGGPIVRSVAYAPVAGYAAGGPISMSSVLSVDYARLGATIAAAQRPNLTVNAGSSSAVAALESLMTWQGRKDRT